jgi:AraC-like DNA-binding protein
MIGFELERSSNNLIYYQFNENLQAGMHFHTNFEFVCVEDGNLTLHISERCFNLTKGMGAIILPSEVHWYETKDYSKSKLCIFSTDFVTESLKIFENSILQKPVFPFRFFNEFSRIAELKDNLFFQKAFFYYICGCAIEGGTQKLSKPKDTNLLYKIIYYINENFKENITLLKMSRDLGYHHVYLSSFLNKNISISFSRLVNERRIEYAKKLLQNSNLNITQISFESGFLSVRNFNRSFFQLEGISPKQFKKNL